MGCLRRFALLAVMLIVPTVSWAAGGEVKPSIVAIVDVQRLLQEAKAAKSVQDQLEGQRSKFQTQIAAEEKELREAEQKLTKLRESASADVYAEQEQILQKRFLTVERHVQARRKSLDQAMTDSMNTVRKGVVDIVSEIAKERGVNLVIVKQQVIWNDQVIDITNEVLERIDKKLPQIQVKVIPEEESVVEPPLLLKPKAKDAKAAPKKKEK